MSEQKKPVVENHSGSMRPVQSPALQDPKAGGMVPQSSYLGQGPRKISREQV